MARIIVQPQCSVSPAGGGTIIYTPSTSGQFIYYQSSLFQNYQFSVTPARGYRFSRYLITTVENWAYHYPDDPGGDYNGNQTYSRQVTTTPYDSSITPRGTLNPSCGGAYWYAEDYGWQQYEYWISSIRVVAEFERIPEGPMLLYDDDSTGRLIYDDGPNNTELLVYGGTLP